jgi:tetratricopeptide (TPR) repeat protein
MKNICCILFIVFSFPLFASTKTFIREYTYTAGEADSKITSRAIALDQVKRILLEEIGVYLQSEMSIIKEEKNNVYNELTKQQIQTITAGVTETKIVEEKWNGEKYYIKASITVDPDEVNNNIARIGADKNKLKELEDIKRKADDAVAEIELLRKQLAEGKNENEKLKTQNEYIAASNSLSASDWLQKANNALEMEELDDAILLYQKAIELDPQYSNAYNNLGAAYRHKGDIDKAIAFTEKAIALEPKNSKAYNNLGIIYYDKRDWYKAIALYKKAIELNPILSEAYNNLGSAYYAIGDIEKQIEFYKKAAILGDVLSQGWLTRNGYTW